MQMLSGPSTRQINTLHQIHTGAEERFHFVGTLAWGKERSGDVGDPTSGQGNVCDVPIVLYAAFYNE